MAKKHREDEDEPELVIANDIELPPPLDPRIAAVALSPQSNYLVDGYDLCLAASFGTEKVLLRSDGVELIANISIRKASIYLKFENCSYHIKSSGDSDGWITNESSATAAESESESHLGLSAEGRFDASLVAGGSSGRVNAGGQARLKSSRRREALRSRRTSEWHIIGSDAVAVEATESRLDGQVIANQPIWRVYPISVDVRSAVIARVNIREDWFDFSEVEYISSNAPFAQGIKNLLKSQRSRRRDLFSILLKHLAYMQLPESPGQLREATIAVGALILKPRAERLDSVPTPPRLSGINIPSHPLKDYILSEPGLEESTLIAYGVPSDQIPSRQEEGGARSKSAAFVPLSQPDSTVQAFEEILRNPGQARLLLDGKLGRNELYSLFALGLIEMREGGVFAKKDAAVNPEYTVKYAASTQSSMKAARAVLQSNQNASVGDIADAVAFQIGRNWENAATRKRYGNSLRMWTIWLEPHLINADEGYQAAALVRSAVVQPRDTARSKSKTMRRGRYTNASLQKRYLELVEQGLAHNEIASQLNVNVRTLYGWRRRLGLQKRRQKK